ncbi:MAG: RNA polymerase sigma factor [Candidatus Woesearchaeota archaeon]
MNQDTVIDELIASQEKLYAFALHLTNNNDQRAKDLRQETILKALEKKNTYTYNKSVLAWSKTIMYNTFINEYRRSQKVVFQATFDSSESTALAHTKTATDLFVQEDINREINSLSSLYKEPFEKFIQGYSYAKISKDIGIPLGTLKSRIFHARKQLKEQLSSYQFSN